MSTNGVMKLLQKIRLDDYLFQNGFCETRSQARALILAGEVLVNDMPGKKAGDIIKNNDVVRVKEKLKYVSRGGLKLEKALQEFNIDAQQKNCLDIGGSTGGFTDCLLQNGAQHVVYIDVGHNQIHWKLRNEPRVTLFENENFRYFDISKLKCCIDLCVVDVSFISLEKIIPKIVEIFNTQPQGDFPKIMVCLIKPQFEASPQDVGKNGIIKDEKIRQNCVKKIINCVQTLGFEDIAVTESPITGRDGNIEYLLKCSFWLKAS